MGDFTPNHHLAKAFGLLMDYLSALQGGKKSVRPGAKNIPKTMKRYRWGRLYCTDREWNAASEAETYGNSESSLKIIVWKIMVSR